MIYSLVIFTLILIVLLSAYRAKALLNPVSVIAFIWLALLGLSLKGLGGIHVPSNATVYIVVSSAMFMCFGGLVAVPKKTANYDLIEKNEPALKFIYFVFCLVPVAIAFLNFLYIVYTSGYLYYLQASRIDGIDRAMSAGGAFNSTILAKVTRPALYFYAFTSIALLVVSGERKPILNAFILLAAISIVFTSRADALVLLVTIILFYPVAGSLKFLSKSDSFRSARRWFLFFFVTILVLLLWVSLLRASDKSLYETFVHYVVNYHTAGFALFDIAYHNSESFIHNSGSYGLITFSTFGFVLQQVDKLLGMDFVAPALIFREEASVPVSVGALLGSSRDYELNAFYTFMAPIYADFGIVGIFIFSMLYGFFLMRSYLSFKIRRDVYSLTLMLFLLWTGYNALLQSAISTDYWWVILLLIFVFHRVRLITLKRNA